MTKDAWDAGDVARIDFRAGSVDGPLDAHGLCEAEADFTWSSGKECGFAMCPGVGAGRYEFALTVQPFMAPPGLMGQRLMVRANGEIIGDVFLSDRANLRFSLPQACDDCERIEISLEHEGACSPHSLGISDDERVLGFALIEARLRRREIGVGRGRVAAVVNFGAGCTDPPLAARGFAPPEAEFCWSLGKISKFSLPPLVAGGELLLELSARPFVFGEMLPSQRLTVLVNGRQIADLRLARAQVLNLRLPDGVLVAGEPVRIVLGHPEAVRAESLGAAGDPRELAFAWRRARLLRVGTPRAVVARGRPALPALGVRNSGRDAGALRDQARGVSSLAPAELMGKFESLGHNCEFGLAQRQMGNETLGLLRFSGIDPSQLIDGLEVGFEGVDEAAGLKIEARGKVTQEFIGRVEKYRIEFHTHRPAEMDKIKAVRREVLASLKFRRRMLLEHMENADKIFVFQNGGAMGVEEARAILTVLRKYGNNSLLFVTESDGEVGSARVVEDGIYHGVVARFAPWDRVDREVDGEVWLSVCANAYRLWREDGGKS